MLLVPKEAYNIVETTEIVHIKDVEQELFPVLSHHLFMLMICSSSKVANEKIKLSISVVKDATEIVTGCPSTITVAIF